MPRFTVERRLASVQVGRGAVLGWVVCSYGDPITRPFETREEALLRCRNITALYRRYGW